MRCSSRGWAWLLGLALALTACGDDDGALDAGGADAQGDGGGGEPVALRVATWNVENLFDARNDPERGDDVPSAGEVAQKLEDIARVLRALDADVVALQEVENEAILRSLAEQVPDLGYTERHLVDSFDGRGIDVACLARVPVTMVANHLGERFPNADGTEEYFFTRDALEVFTEKDGVPVTVMILHLRSMLDGGDDIRLAEALQARRIADRRLELGGVERMLIVGDMNDFPGSPTLDALLEGGSFVDLTLGIPVDDRWTFTFRGMRQQVDYVIGTPNMNEDVESIRILHGPEVDAASDHSPIVADFRIAR